MYILSACDFDFKRIVQVMSRSLFVIEMKYSYSQFFQLNFLSIDFTYYQEHRSNFLGVRPKSGKSSTEGLSTSKGCLLRYLFLVFCSFSNPLKFKQDIMKQLRISWKAHNLCSMLSLMVNCTRLGNECVGKLPLFKEPH